MIAVIAGRGTLPHEACKQLLFAEKNFFVLSLFSDMRDQLASTVGSTIPVITQDRYKLSTIQHLLREYKTQQVLFIGKVDKKDIFNQLKFDWLAVKLLTTLLYKSDQAIMECFIAELKKDNIAVLSQKEFLHHLHIPPGIITGKITDDLKKQIHLGLSTAITMANLGIGQSVVIKDGVIIAVEAVEGTDACLTRSIQLAHNNLILCKAAAKNHNDQYDLPTLGASSLAHRIKGEIAAIAWVSQQTLIADYEAFVDKANDLGITLVSVDERELQQQKAPTQAK